MAQQRTTSNSLSINDGTSQPTKKSSLALSRAEIGPERQEYSAFTKWQKRWIVGLATFAGWFSTASSFVFFPAITSISRSLRTSVEKINLTVTSYLLLAAVAPSIIGSLTDVSGRRLTYIGLLLVYMVSNIGLGLQNHFAGLFVLRMVQSAGIAASYSMAYGVLTDISTPSERGSFVGVLEFGSATAPSLSPLLAGVLNATLGWRSIFWFLSISSGVCLVVIVLSLPETSRKLVGNGSIPPRGLRKVPLRIMSVSGDSQVDSKNVQRPSARPTWYQILSQPFVCVRVILRRDQGLVLVGNSIQYAVFTALQASLSTLFIKIYAFKDLEAGLIYLPFGCGCMITGYLAGKLLDRDYRVTAKEHGFTIDRKYGEDLANFPIEEARLRSYFVANLVFVGAIAGYGWSLQTKSHYSIPLVIQFILAVGRTVGSTAANTLLVDLDPDNAVTAQAASNLVRCLLAAGVVTALQPLVDAVNVGWCFTIIAGFAALMLPLMAVERIKGFSWRQERVMKSSAAEATEKPAAETEKGA